MQICALDSAGSFIYADQANKQQNYQCIECSQILRLRHGIHRQAHFYHTQPNRICKQHAKGMPHLMLQQFLKNILPAGESQLECPFKTIGRIADVAWHPKRLIFEIQCSPISAGEVKQRNEDYASAGYQVVWIFHEERYNQYRISPAENSLQNHPHYFTDMNENGEGKIYDQFAVIINGKRIRRFSALSIDPASPKYFNNDPKIYHQVPFLFRERLKSWPLAFAGDVIDCFSNPESLPDELKDLSFYPNPTTLLNFLKQFVQNRILRPYLAVIKLVLERACR